MKATVMLIRHGRDEFFPWLWRDLFMAVERSYHGRGEAHYRLTEVYRASHPQGRHTLP